MSAAQTASGLRMWLHDAVADRWLIFAIITAVFIMGAVTGVVGGATYGEPARQELAGYVQAALSSLAEQGAAPAGGAQAVLINQVIKSAGLLWLLGLSVVGAPLVAAVIFVHGFVMGFAAGFIIGDLGWRGIILACFSLAPHNLLIIPGLICVAAGATAFSLQALSVLLGKRHDQGVFEYMRREGALALFGCLLLTGGGLVQTYITPAITVTASRYFV